MVSENQRSLLEHNVSATTQVDDDGNEFVRMIQDQGFDIQIDNFVTAGTAPILVATVRNGVTSAAGKTAAIAGGSIIIDAPTRSSFRQMTQIIQSCWNTSLTGGSGREFGASRLPRLDVRRDSERNHRDNYIGCSTANNSG